MSGRRVSAHYRGEGEYHVWNCGKCEISTRKKKVYLIFLSTPFLHAFLHFYNSTFLHFHISALPNFHISTLSIFSIFPPFHSSTFRHIYMCFHLDVRSTQPSPSPSPTTRTAGRPTPGWAKAGRTPPSTCATTAATWATWPPATTAWCSLPASGEVGALTWAGWMG